MSYILSVEGLSVAYFMPDKTIYAVKDVSFGLEKDEILGIIGESGSGKSTVVHAILRLIKPPGRILTGRVYYNKRDILQMSEEEFSKEIRWSKISLVPQASQNALNPVITIENTFYYTAESHGITDKEKVKEKAIELLKMVGLDPKRVLKMYPFQLSGGMKQRVLIALSLLLNPEIILMDEPTSALDILNERLIMKLVKDLNKQLGVTIVFVTHDIAVVADIADRLLVMYKGEIMEIGKNEDIISNPFHPYTQMLISSIPTLKGSLKYALPPEDIPGEVKGCVFWPRCPYVMDKCKVEAPKNYYVSGRIVRCYLHAPNAT